MQTWDPAVVLLLKGMGYLFLVAVVCAVLHATVKHAVAAGITLAADEFRERPQPEPESSRPE